jgi:uncharacterized membrane protein
MFRPILLGLAAGQRAMTPLAVLTGAARQGKLPADAPKFLSHPLITAAGVLLAAGEMAGDKQKTAPDRIVPAGLAARSLTSAFAGAVLAGRDRRVQGAVFAAAAAVASSYLGWSARMWAMKRYGQTASGAVEDALVLASGWAAATARR